MHLPRGLETYNHFWTFPFLTTPAHQLFCKARVRFVQRRECWKSCHLSGYRPLPSTMGPHSHHTHNHYTHYTWLHPFPNPAPLGHALAPPSTIPSDAVLGLYNLQPSTRKDPCRGAFRPLPPSGPRSNWYDKHVQRRLDLLST